jgi:DNA polymerase (family 10)
MNLFGRSILRLKDTAGEYTMPSQNREIANIFNEIADLLEIAGENAFRINSYRKAARIIEDLPDEAGKMLDAGKLADVSGIGEHSRQKIEEYLKTGKISALDDLLNNVPAGLIDLLKIPGMGPKTVAVLWKTLGVEDIEGLVKCLRTDQLEKLPGMGAKKIENIKKGLEFITRSAGRKLLGIALPIAEEIQHSLQQLDGVKNVEIAGSLRRRAETVGDIDILVQADQGEFILKKFTSFPQVKEILAAGETKASVRITDDIQVDVRVVPAESFGAAMQYFTGSKEHNVHLRELAVKKIWKLNEYGLFEGEKRLAGETEEGIYAKFELPWIPPELRENRGEIEAGKKLPKLLEATDIKGDLHMHTTASDGRCSIEEMIEACIARGYEYMCITDHSTSSHIANGLDPNRLKEHIHNVRHAAKKYQKEIAVLIGSEVDILADGKLDYEDALLAELDFVIASIHSGLGQSSEKTTSRILKAMDNHYVRAIGHPTGRLIGQREASEMDMPAIIKHAVETDTWLELNSHWMRLDLKDVHLKQARDAGAKIIIGTDSHDTSSLNNIRYGVFTARRGWLEKADVVNTLPGVDFLNLLKR